jgi:tetratricopeptide (TPR) repeat protein
MDFDLAIRLGEAELDEQLGSSPGREDRLPFVMVPLAAAYHHRACVAWSRGDRDQAARDLARAIELDAHARYLTTAALWSEAGGDLDAAAEHHDRAVAATLAPVGWYVDDDGFGEDRDVARR